MGEYAFRRPDGEHIKIGTCEDMYYIRFEDRKKVKPDEHSLDCSKELDLRWRLPFPDEDHILPGNYMDFNRSEPLHDYDMEFEPEGDLKMGWTNKKDHFVLSSVKNTQDGIVAIVKCKVCGEMWKTKLENVIDHIQDQELKTRISNYQDI